MKEGLGVDLDGGSDVLARAGSFVIFSVKTLHNSRPNTTRDPRRLVLFAHAPRQEPQVHPGNTSLLTSAGAHVLAFLRARSASASAPRL